MKKINFIFGAIIFFITLANAQSFQVNLSNLGSTSTANSNIIIQTLNYDPHPVNPGELFDVYLYVQNVGQNDAQNVQFQILPNFPFSTNEPPQNFAVVYGTIDAYKLGFQNNANAIILHFRVKADDNAPPGISNLKFLTTIKNSFSTETDLPIQIADTKTDFEVVMQSSNAQGTSFGIANIGNNPASAITFSVIPDDIKVSGAQSSIIGNLAPGDFTTVTFALSKSGNFSATQANIQISYTDIAGIRTVITKKVPVTFAPLVNTATATSRFSLIDLIIGIIIGILILWFYRRIRKK